MAPFPIILSDPPRMLLVPPQLLWVLLGHEYLLEFCIMALYLPHFNPSPHPHYYLAHNFTVN